MRVQLARIRLEPFLKEEDLMECKVICFRDKNSAEMPNAESCSGQPYSHKTLELHLDPVTDLVLEIP